MIVRKSQRVWAIIIALVLILTALSGGLFASRLAHAEGNQIPQGVTVNFDFASVEGKGEFANNVWAYQWSNSSGATEARKVSKTAKSVVLHPFPNESTVNFIIFIGTFDGSNIHPWNRWGTTNEQAQTTDINNATPGSFFNVSYDNLNKNSSAPQKLADKTIYNPVFQDSNTAEQGQNLIIPAPKFVAVDGAEYAIPVSGQPTYKISEDNALNATVAPTGDISVHPGFDVSLGNHKISVEVTYADQTKDTVEVTVNVTASQVMKLTYTPNPAIVKQGKSTTITPTAQLNGVPSVVPQSATYSLLSSPHSAIKIDGKTGVVTVSPGSDAQLGEYDVSVVAKVNDTKVAEGNARISIVAPETEELQSQLWITSYPDLTIAQRENRSLPLTATLFGKERALPRGVTFTLNGNIPSWVSVDKSTGELTVTPDEWVAATSYKFYIITTHLDGSSNVIPVNITVTEGPDIPELDSHLWKLSYANLEVQQLKSGSVELTSTLFGKERALPHGISFAKGANMPSWITVDPQTGTVTTTPDEFVAIQNYTFNVAVTHLDGKTEKVAINIKVTEADPETTYPLTPLKPGKHTIPALKLTPAQSNADQAKPQPQTPKPVETSSTGLAKTGLDLGGLTGLALLSMLTGATMAHRRKA